MVCKKCHSEPENITDELKDGLCPECYEEEELYLEKRTGYEQGQCVSEEELKEEQELSAELERKRVIEHLREMFDSYHETHNKGDIVFVEKEKTEEFLKQTMVSIGQLLDFEARP